MSEGSRQRDDEVAGLPAVKLCKVPEVKPREFDAGLDPARVRAIVGVQDKWANGTELRYNFMQQPPDADDVEVVRRAFAQWEGLPIGLRFLEVPDASEAEIRIAFDHDDGSWSYLGRQILSRPAVEPTMNFGWRLSGWDYGRDTALHEIGHAMGLPHEHQNPNAGIVWDEPRVLQHFAGSPNFWNEDVTRWNILRKIPPDAVQGSGWDADSVMHYRFERGLISRPERFRDEPLVPAGDLSPRDIEWVKSFYPELEERLPELTPFESRALALGPADQVNFAVVPQATRRYTFGTFGDADTVLVLFEEVQTGPEEGRGPRFLAGDDDSGTDRNAQFTAKLYKGHEYVLRLRLYWPSSTGRTAVMMW